MQRPTKTCLSALACTFPFTVSFASWACLESFKRAVANFSHVSYNITQHYVSYFSFISSSHISSVMDRANMNPDVFLLPVTTNKYHLSAQLPQSC